MRYRRLEKTLIISSEMLRATDGIAPHGVAAGTR